MSDERMHELTQKLEQGVKDVFSSDNYRNYLNTMSKFHHYSFRNSMLIFMQNPEATQVAGFGAWKQMGRSINKGENGIQILAPAPYKKTITVTQDDVGKPLDEPKEKEVTVTAFRPVYVFDVSQTNGRELPSITTRLTGSIEEYDKLLQALCEVSPCPISIQEIDGTANGYYSPNDSKIVIKKGLSQEQTVKTAVHEIAHALLGHGHDKSISRQSGEVQAESVAYITCQHLGIDSSQYTFGYVALWSTGKELAELQASLEVIQKTSGELIARLDDRFDKLHALEAQRTEPQQATQQVRVPRLSIDERLRAARTVSEAINEAKSPQRTRSHDMER